MLTFEELWQRLNTLDESVEIEAKHGSQIGDSAMETVSAFSNEPHRGGGYLLFGVQQKADSLFPDYEIVGVPNPDKLQTDLASRCNTDLNYPVRPIIQSERQNDRTVIYAFVPEVPLQQKPIFIKKRGLQQSAYRRIGSSDLLCSEEDIAYFYQAQTHRTYDETLVEDASPDDLDPDMLREYRRVRAAANPNAAELAMADPDLLYALNAVTRTGGRLVPTIGGLLVFGTRAAIRRYFPSMRVDYIRVPGREWIPDPTNRYDTVEILDPLLRAIPRAISQIMDDLPKAFHLATGEDRRRDIPLLPYEVVREVVVNAVMHRNYRIRGSVQIIRYSNRLEIRNPGISLVSDDRLGEPGSITRNEKIAAILHETQYAETKGTGIRAVRELMKRFDLAPPFFESDREKDTFAAYLLFHHLLSPDDLAWLNGFREYGLSPEDQKALVYVREIGAINNALYRTINGVETLVASAHLRRLRDQGLLLPKGQGRAAYYVPASAFFKSVSSEPEPLSSEQPLLSSKPESLSSEPGNLPEEVTVMISELGRRASSEQVRSAILRICSLRSMRADELARLLGRDAVYLRHQHLRPLLEDGLLAYLYPEYPTHPQQAYRTIRLHDP